ncbi:MAG: hypothetical protein OEV40_30465 [Acidimicrobiia bacterium]|nr:hypothetical protein [Acidimicrobiia bacterium]
MVESHAFRLRPYEIFDHNKVAFHKRFEEHEWRIVWIGVFAATQRVLRFGIILVVLMGILRPVSPSSSGC